MTKEKARGFSIIEILVAIGIFAIVATSGITLFLQLFTTSRLDKEQTQAKQIAQETIEATRSIATQNWKNLVTGTHGLTTTNGHWEFFGTNNTIGKFTRQVTIAGGQRTCGAGVTPIVESGGLPDPGLFKVKATVDWNVTPTRHASVSLETYLTKYRQVTVGNWSPPNQVATLDLSGTGDALKVRVQGTYAYVIRSTSPQFQVIDISNPANPSLVASLALAGNARDLFIQGTNAYVASEDNSEELQIIDISNPTSPAKIGSYNAPSTANALSVSVAGNYAYLTRDSSTEAELYVIDISNPTSPTLSGSLELGAAANAIYIRQQSDFAYIASSSNTSELQVISIANPSSPSLVGTFNASGNQDALSVTGFCDTVFLGESNGQVYIINTSTPSAPTQISSFDAQSSVNDLVLFHRNRYLLAVTNRNNAQLQAINATNLASPTLLGTLASGNGSAGVAYSYDQDRAYVATSGNNQELFVAGP